MKLYYVYKEEYCHYSSNRGSLVYAKDWQTAKGIVMADWNYKDRKNVKVEEVNISEGIICDTDYIYKVK